MHIGLASVKFNKKYKYFLITLLSLTRKISRIWLAKRKTIYSISHSLLVNMRFWNFETLKLLKYQNHNRKRKRCVIYSSDSSDEQ